jgi:hypothetical protein
VVVVGVVVVGLVVGVVVVGVVGVVGEVVTLAAGVDTDAFTLARSRLIKPPRPVMSTPCPCAIADELPTEVDPDPTEMVNKPRIFSEVPGSTSMVVGDCPGKDTITLTT